MSTNIVSVKMNVGPQGRVVIPVELRRAWNLEPGETLVARLENDKVTLERPEQALKRVLARFAHLVGGPSMADELIAERRLAAQREREEMAE
jgi:AbrB family looped-hinge helix DNA binding protein